MDDPETWKPLYDAPDDELWAIHRLLKEQLVGWARQQTAAPGMLAPLSPVRYPWNRCSTLMR